MKPFTGIVRIIIQIIIISLIFLLGYLDGYKMEKVKSKKVKSGLKFAAKQTLIFLVIVILLELYLRYIACPYYFQKY